MIAWFAKNSVAANILMLALIASGALTLLHGIPLEAFPPDPSRDVTVSVELRGASPEDIEQSITVRIEEAIADLIGIDQLRSVSTNGMSTVTASARRGTDPNQLLERIKSRVDSISTLPDRAEQPTIHIAEDSYETVAIIVSGQRDYHEIRQYAEQVRQDLIDTPAITQVSLDSVKRHEITIEITPHTLRDFNLSMEEVAAAIRNNAVSVTAGDLKGENGSVVLLSDGRAFHKNEFESIAILSSEDGANVTLGDIAQIKDGFEEQGIRTRFNGKNAVFVGTYRVGDQNAIDVAEAVHQYVDSQSSVLPEGIELTIWDDESLAIKNRIGILLRSGIQGGIFVMIILSMFLRPSVAFWTFIGIPVSFLGSFAVLNITGTTLNLMSIFGYILVLGIVVDDAIVTSESIHSHRTRGLSPVSAAVEGTQAIASPVAFGVLSTIVAFVPLWAIDGNLGRLFAPIATVVVPVLLLSFIETKLILPAHLTSPDQLAPRWAIPLRQIGKRIERFTLEAYRPALEFAIYKPLKTIALALFCLAITSSLLKSGLIEWEFYPDVESETMTATLTMPPGTPMDQLDQQIMRLTESAMQMQREFIDPEAGRSLITNIISFTGASDDDADPVAGEVQFELIPLEERSIETPERSLSSRWQELTGPMTGAESLSYQSDLFQSGADLVIELTGRDSRSLEIFADQVNQMLSTTSGVTSVYGDLSSGMRSFDIELTREAKALGFTRSQILNSIYDAVNGMEVQRVQRGRDDVRVILRYPIEFRKSYASLDKIFVDSANGHRVPVSNLVTVHAGTSPETIRRINQKREVSISVELDKSVADLAAIRQTMDSFLAAYTQRNPTLDYQFAGQYREEEKSAKSMLLSVTGVLMTIYALLALSLRSYWSPILVLTIVPFGLVGAILGHLILGYSVSILSLLGMLALSGILINDSLVLLNTNRKHQNGEKDDISAVKEAALNRLRPVILTSVTTFAGLTPLLLEQSSTAQFLVPMAISLGFGILFSSAVTLLLVPALVALISRVRETGNQLTSR